MKVKNSEELDKRRKRKIEKQKQQMVQELVLPEVSGNTSTTEWWQSRNITCKKKLTAFTPLGLQYTLLEQCVLFKWRNLSEGKSDPKILLDFQAMLAQPSVWVYHYIMDQFIRWCWFWWWLITSHFTSSELSKLVSNQ